ncbi:MAG: PorT family protein [Draconibacterium sp.]|nr:PorT family protein [Draconibacterium sp.]
MLFFFIEITNAQNLKFEIGIGHTYQLDKHNETDISDQKFMFNYSVGLTNEFEIQKNSFIRTGLIFEKNGRKEIISLGEGTKVTNLDRTVKLWYLKLPVSYKQYVKINKLNCFFELGAYGGYGLFGNDTYPSWENETWITKSKKLKFSMNKLSGLPPFDFGLISKVGVKIAKIDINLRYMHGLLDQNNQPGRTIKNRSLMISFGVPL